jgi:hypothetical protein
LYVNVVNAIGAIVVRVTSLDAWFSRTKVEF